MRTTIDLPDPLFRQAKALAAQRGSSLKDLFTDVLSRALNEPDRTERRMDVPPILRERTSRIPARTNEELALLLEQEETDKLP